MKTALLGIYLAVVGLSAASAQVRTPTAASAWKEYAYPSVGFAITLPHPPNPHQDTTMPDMNAYSVSVTPDTRFTLRVTSIPRDCTDTLRQLKDGALQGKDGIDPSSIRDVSLESYPGLEYELGAPGEQRTYDRFLCVKQRFYIFTASWPAHKGRPDQLNRIVKSFRLLK